MSDLPTPTASRLRTPSWRDGRLIVGVLLVLTSTALGAFVIAGLDDRVPMYAARHQLVPGQALGADDLVRVDVQLGDAAAGYLAASAPVPADAHVLRELRPGELVPVTAVGGAAAAQTQPVVLQVDATSASALVAGSVVDVYVNKPAEGEAANAGGAPGSTRYAGPEQVLQSVTVAGVATEDGMLAVGSGTRPVQVMIPRDRVRQVIGDVDQGARITLVPTPGSVRKAAS